MAGGRCLAMAPSAATPILRELHSVHCSTPRLPGGDTVPTRTPRFGTLEEMAAARKRSQVPHHSYALDKPVCDMTQRDFFLARKFDVDGKGFLTEQEQEAAKQALAQGYGEDHYSDYYEHKPQTRFQKTLRSTLPFARTSYSDTFNRCLTEFDERNARPTAVNTPLTRSKLLRTRTLAEQEELAKKIQRGWTESVDRLRPKQTGKQETPSWKREGYVENPKHKTRTEILQSRKDKRRPKDGYDWNGNLGVSACARHSMALWQSTSSVQRRFTRACFVHQVSAREFFVASQFDQGHKLELTVEERTQMENALKNGFGQDTMATYFSHRNPPPDSRVARVLRHTFRQDARRLEDSFNRTIGNECGGFEERNTEATWISTTQESHGTIGDKAASPLEAWRQAGKPEPEVQKRKYAPKTPTTDQFGVHTSGQHDTGTCRVTAAELEQKAVTASPPLTVRLKAEAVTDRTHHRPSRKPSPPLTVRARPSTGDGMRSRYKDWSSPQGRPASQGRAAGKPLERTKGAGCLNMFWPMPPGRN